MIEFGDDLLVGPQEMQPRASGRERSATLTVVPSLEDQAFAKSLIPGAQKCAKLNLVARGVKRGFDIALSATALLTFGWMIPVLVAAATVSTRELGLFRQVRIGKNGEKIIVWKIRTMRSWMVTTVVAAADARAITPLGRFLRRYQLDELPQLVLILIGRLSFVGPRPDVPGLADVLEGADRTVLGVRPGLAGLATYRFNNEDEILAEMTDVEAFNRDVLFPEKVRLNRAYVENYSIRGDLALIMLTIARSLGRPLPKLERRTLKRFAVAESWDRLFESPMTVRREPSAIA